MVAGRRSKVIQLGSIGNRAKTTFATTNQIRRKAFWRIDRYKFAEAKMGVADSYSTVTDFARLRG